MTTGQTFNNKIAWEGNGKSKFNNFLGGKSMTEFKNMSNEERLSLISNQSKQLRTVSSPSEQRQTKDLKSKFLTGDTSFDFSYFKSMTEDKKSKMSVAKELRQSLVSGSTKTQKLASAPHTPITEKPSDLVKVDRPRRASGSTKYEGTLSVITGNTRSTSFTPNPDGEFVSGTVDQTFPTSYDGGFNGIVYAIEIQSDGYILVGGDFGSYYKNGSEYYSPYLSRINSNGDFDYNFSTDNIDGDVYSIAIQEDGKILLGGNFTFYDGNYTPNIVRINSDGSYDNTFFVGNGFDGYVNDIKIQSDGKIVIGGNFGYYNNIISTNICRLNINGSLDSSFISQLRNDNTGFDGEVNAIQIQQDGKIVVGGNFGKFYVEGSQIGNCPYISRLNSDGSYDTTFQIGNGFNNYVNTIALQSDGKIIVGGNFYDTGRYNNTICNSIVRLNTDGTLESTFGFGIYGEVIKITVQSDDKILVGGYLSSYFPYFNDYYSFTIDEIIRFNADTTFDYSFYYGELLNDSPWAITLDSEGKIYIGGEFTYDPNNEFLLNQFGRLNNKITKYKYTYSVINYWNNQDKTFSVGSNEKLTRDDDGRTVKLRSLLNPSEFVFGNVNVWDDRPYPYGVPQYEISEIYGSYDNAYASALEYKYVYAESLLDGSGDNFIVSNLYQVGDIFFIDQSYDDEGFRVRSCFKIIGENWFNPYNFYTPIPYVPYETCEECVEANGVYYNAYPGFMGPGIDFLSYQYFNILNDSPVALLPTDFFGDFPMVVSGSDSFFNIEDYQNVPIVRSTKVFNSIPQDVEYNYTEALSYLGSGILDYDYNPYDGNNKGVNDWVFVTKQQPDGKTLVYGFFDRYDNERVGNLIRLNQDGSLDYRFNVEVYGFVNGIEIGLDNSIFIYGSFEGVNDTLSYNLAKLDRYGNVDKPFSSNLMLNGGFGGDVYSLVIAESGNIIACGGFEGFGGRYAAGFIQLNAEGTIDENYYETQVFFSSNANNLKLQSDGKILIGGNFTGVYDQVTDQPYNVGYMVRLNINGSLDFSFNTDGYPALWSENTPFTSTTTGSLYFSNDAIISGNTDISVWELQLNAFTFEWFQYFNGDLSVSPTVFDYIGGYLTVYFGSDNTISLFVNGDVYKFDLNTNIENSWNYFAITRQNNDPNTWIVYQNGVQIGTFDKSIPYGQGQPLIIGGPSNYVRYNYGVGYFTGNITNFRVTNGAALYTSETYPVPTEPLNHDEGPGNTILLLSVDNSGHILDDSSDDNVQFSMYGNINPGFNDYVDLITYHNGLIYVTGEFSNYNEDYIGYGLTLLDKSGSWVPDFNIGDGLNNTINDLKIQSDGKLLIGGWFDYYDAWGGWNSPYLIRLNTDGSPDTSFLPTIFNYGFNDVVWSIDLDKEGNAIIGGWFDDYAGTSVGINGGVTKLFTNVNTVISTFYVCGEDGLQNYPGIRTSYKNQDVITKGEVNIRPSVCGYVGGEVDLLYKKSGSIRFDGDDYISSSSSSDWSLVNNDFTIEWFQYRETSPSCCPRIFTLGQVNSGGVTIAVSIENNQFYLWLNGNTYNFGNLNDDYNWTAFAITRRNNIIRVFKNGVQVFNINDNNGLPILYMEPLINDYDSLYIGNDPSDVSSAYYGYLTNFRWNNGKCLYTSDYDVSLYPLLNVYDSSTLLLMDNSEDPLYDTTGRHTFNYDGSGSLTWTTDTPFQYTYELYNTNGLVNYDGCYDCQKTEVLQAITYQRDGVNPDKVVRTTLTQNQIYDIYSKGPIFTYGPYRECYELLTYYK